MLQTRSRAGIQGGNWERWSWSKLWRLSRIWFHGDRRHWSEGTVNELAVNTCSFSILVPLAVLTLCAVLILFVGAVLSIVGGLAPSRASTYWMTVSSSPPQLGQSKMTCIWEPLMYGACLWARKVISWIRTQSPLMIVSFTFAFQASVLAPDTKWMVYVSFVHSSLNGAAKNLIWNLKKLDRESLEVDGPFRKLL